MGWDPAEEKGLMIACPKCRAQYRVMAGDLGAVCHCTACGERFPITPERSVYTVYRPPRKAATPGRWVGPVVVVGLILVGAGVLLGPMRGQVDQFIQNLTEHRPTRKVVILQPTPPLVPVTQPATQPVVEAVMPVRPAVVQQMPAVTPPPPVAPVPVVELPPPWRVLFDGTTFLTEGVGLELGGPRGLRRDAQVPGDRLLLTNGWYMVNADAVNMAMRAKVELPDRTSASLLLRRSEEGFCRAWYSGDGTFAIGVYRRGTERPEIKRGQTKKTVGRSTTMTFVAAGEWLSLYCGDERVVQMRSKEAIHPGRFGVAADGSRVIFWHMDIRPIRESEYEAWSGERLPEMKVETGGITELLKELSEQK